MSKTSKKSKEPKKRHYERSTAVGRVHKNITKALKMLTFAAARMESWARSPGFKPVQGSLDMVLSNSLDKSKGARALLVQVDKGVLDLSSADWSPPKRSLSVVFSVGDLVRIAGKYRDKYLKIYTRKIIDRLAVTKILPTGELAVKHVHSNLSFLVVKSHIEHRRG